MKLFTEPRGLELLTGEWFADAYGVFPADESVL